MRHIHIHKAVGNRIAFYLEYERASPACRVHSLQHRDGNHMVYAYIVVSKWQVNVCIIQRNRLQIIHMLDFFRGATASAASEYYKGAVDCSTCWRPGNKPKAAKDVRKHRVYFLRALVVWIAPMRVRCERNMICFRLALIRQISLGQAETDTDRETCVWAMKTHELYNVWFCMLNPVRMSDVLVDQKVGDFVIYIMQRAAVRLRHPILGTAWFRRRWRRHRQRQRPWANSLTI